MIETKIIVDSKPKLKNPVCIVGLPGIGNIGRIAIGYAIQQLKAKKFAELYSPNFFPFVMIHDNKIHVLRNEFYYYKGGKRDFIFIIGDTQSSDQAGHYEVAGKILEFVKSLGCKEVVTIGGFGTGKVVEKPVVVHGKIEIKPIMMLSLSYDHRIVDGAPASEFLRKVKEKLEKAEIKL